MSHELRTPLNAVIGYSQLLLEDAVDEGDEETASDLQKIHTAGQHLLGLVSDVLDLSKIVAGKMEVNPERIVVRDLVRDAAKDCIPLAAKNGNSVNVSIADDVGEMVGDPRKIRQIVCHLTDNAAKFTHDGRIDVNVWRTAAPGDHSVVVEVRDTGVGIPEALIPELFEKFRVAEDTSSSKYGGTGLGLALCQQLCQLMGGDIRVTSEVGLGSCFTFWLPTEPENATAARSAEATAAEGDSRRVSSLAKAA
jgi:signal transduction histidine kinase